MKTLRVQSVGQWREWLDEYHASAPDKLRRLQKAIRLLTSGTVPGLT
jgi:hypothetical protein